MIAMQHYCNVPHARRHTHTPLKLLITSSAIKRFSQDQYGEMFCKGAFSYWYTQKESVQFVLRVSVDGSRVCVCVYARFTLTFPAIYEATVQKTSSSLCLSLSPHVQPGKHPPLPPFLRNVPQLL